MYVSEGCSLVGVLVSFLCDVGGFVFSISIVLVFSKSKFCDLENEPEHGPPIPLFYLKETEEQFYFSSVVKSPGRTGSLSL